MAGNIRTVMDVHCSSIPLSIALILNFSFLYRVQGRSKGVFRDRPLRSPDDANGERCFARSPAEGSSARRVSQSPGSAGARFPGAPSPPGD